MQITNFTANAFFSPDDLTFIYTGSSHIPETLEEQTGYSALRYIYELSGSSIIQSSFEGGCLKESAGY